MIEALYIHIPFCEHICHYCDFPKLVIDQDKQDAYVKALITELSFYKNDLGALKTIYVGGGTPSWLKKVLWKRLIASMENIVDFNQIKEFTVEANPIHVDREWMTLWKDSYVTRISLGVQSTQEKTLKVLGRRHRQEDIRRAVGLLTADGAFDLNLDFMHGVFEQTLEDVRADLEYVSKTKPTHISYYGLILEEGTILDHKDKQGLIRLPDEDLAVSMIETVNQSLRRMGYRHYEISNYCLDGKESLHNLAYWRMKPYLGVGMGASSQAFGRRFKNDDRLFGYINRVKQTNRGVVKNEPYDAMQEYVLMGLRTKTGIDLSSFVRRFKVDVFKAYPGLDRFLDGPFLKADRGRLYLTETGMMVSNQIFLSLF